MSFASWRCLAAWGDARMRLYRGFRVVCLSRLGVVWFVETWRAASPVIGAVRGISVSSAKSCRDAFSRLGTRDCRMKSPAAKAWRLAETQECVSTGGFRVVCLLRLGVAWRLGETQECVSTGGFRVVCLSRLGVAWRLGETQECVSTEGSAWFALRVSACEGGMPPAVRGWHPPPCVSRRAGITPRRCRCRRAG